MHRPDFDLPILKKPRREPTATTTADVIHTPRFPCSRFDSVSSRQRRERMRRRRMVRRREYQRLRSMVPSIATKPLVSKVTVIEEAIRYIDYLHGALLTRLRTRGLPHCLQGVSIDVNQLGHEDIKDLVRQLVESSHNQPQQPSQAQQQQPPRHRESPATSSGTALERVRQVPSYLTSRRQHRKRS